MADIFTTDPALSQPGDAIKSAAVEAPRYSRTGDMLKAKMTHLVKGAGFVGNGNTPLSDPGVVTTKAHQATMELRSETHRGYTNRASVVKSMNPGFLDQFGTLKTALNMPSVGEQISQVLNQIPGGGDALKSFTAGNLGM